MFRSLLFLWCGGNDIPLFVEEARQLLFGLGGHRAHHLHHRLLLLPLCRVVRFEHGHALRADQRAEQPVGVLPGERTRYCILGRCSVAVVDEGDVVQPVVVDEALCRVERGERVAYRVDAHQAGRIAQVLVAVRNAQRIEAVVHLGAVYLFEVDVYAVDVGIGQRPCGVDVQRGEDVLPCGHLRDGLAVVLLDAALLHVLDAVDAVFQDFQFVVQFALHERRGKMRHERGIAAALGDDAFADIIDGVDVEVGHVADEYIGPVVIRQRHLLAGNEFEAAVRPEMDERVRTEPLARPEIGGYVGIGGSSLHAVHDFFRVLADGRQRLRQNGDVAEHDARHRDVFPALLLDAHVFARSLAVRVAQFLAQLFGKDFLCPFREGLHIDEFGVAVLQEFVVCAERIGAEYGALGLYHPFERRSVGGQAGYVVTGIAQRLQRIVERLHAFDIGRRNGTLAGSLVVVDGDLLLAVGRVVQTGIVFYQTAEFVRVDGNGVEEFHAVALELCGHGVRCDGTVQFGHHDAHRGHAARCHSLPVGQPVLVQVADGDRCEDGHVEFPEHPRTAFAAAHDEPAVGTVDDDIRRHRPYHAELLHSERVDGIDVQPAFFEGIDDGGHVLLVGVLHVDVARKQRHTGCSLPVAS